MLVAPFDQSQKGRSRFFDIVGMFLTSHSRCGSQFAFLGLSGSYSSFQLRASLMSTGSSPECKVVLKSECW